MALLSTGIAVLEVTLFDIVGRVVDLLATNTPEAVGGGAGRDVLWLALGILLIYPLMVGLQSLLLHQTLAGNFPMIVR
jgi:ATP-binding cassette subfamily B multidrug efflux pump